jgi:hypothetical protein
MSLRFIARRLIRSSVCPELQSSGVVRRPFRRVVSADPPGADGVEHFTPIIDDPAIFQRTEVSSIVGDVVLVVSMPGDASVDGWHIGLRQLLRRRIRELGWRIGSQHPYRHICCS